MRTRIIAVAIDCRDPEALAAFWCHALGISAVERWQDAHGTTYVEIGGAGEPHLLFQPVPEAKPAKNRVHLDLAPEHLDQYAEIDRLVALGARVVTDDPAERFLVLADPEDNEFCVLPPRT